MHLYLSRGLSVNPLSDNIAIQHSIWYLKTWKQQNLLSKKKQITAPVQGWYTFQFL